MNATLRDNFLRELAIEIAMNRKGMKMAFTREDILEDIDNRYRYHKPTEKQVLLYEALRANFKELAMLIVDLTPICPDQTVALRKLHDANMAANLTIACNEDGS